MTIRIRRVRRRPPTIGLVSKPLEADHQEAFFQWLAYVSVPNIRGWRPLKDYAFAIPNGSMIAGDAKQRAKYIAAMKRRGWKNGVSDVFIAYPMFGASGLWLEFKRDAMSPVRKEQEDWIELMNLAGYTAAVVCSLEEAQHQVKQYLGLLPTSSTTPARV